MKIFFPTKGIFDGCMYYRLDPYVKVCQETKIDYSTGTIKDLVQLFEMGAFDAKQFDLFIMHSPMSLDEFRVFEAIKNAGVPILLDYDDLIWNMPMHWANQSMHYPAVYKASLECLINADYITVSTHRLKAEIQSFNPSAPIQLIENALHPQLIERAKWNKISNKARLLWRGNHSKLGDLYQIRQAIKPYENVEWRFFGAKPYWLHKHYGGSFDSLQFYTSVPMEKYLSELCRMEHNFGLIALDDHPCNHCKSNVAWLENIVAGAVTVAPSGFDELFRLGVIQYSSSDALMEFIQSNRILFDMSEMFELSKQEALQRYNLEQKNKVRLSIIESVMAKH